MPRDPFAGYCTRWDRSVLCVVLSLGLGVGGGRGVYHVRTCSAQCALYLPRSLSPSRSLSRSRRGGLAGVPATLSEPPVCAAAAPGAPPAPPPAVAFADLELLFCLKHRNSIPVAFLVSASVRLTPSRLFWRFSSPGLRVYACEILLYSSDNV